MKNKLLIIFILLYTIYVNRMILFSKKIENNKIYNMVDTNLLKIISDEKVFEKIKKTTYKQRIFDFDNRLGSYIHKHGSDYIILSEKYNNLNPIIRNSILYHEVFHLIDNYQSFNVPEIKPIDNYQWKKVMEKVIGISCIELIEILYYNYDKNKIYLLSEEEIVVRIIGLKLFLYHQGVIDSIHQPFDDNVYNYLFTGMFSLDIYNMTENDVKIWIDVITYLDFVPILPLLENKTIFFNI
jgi:hypothetical protein